MTNSIFLLLEIRNDSFFIERVATKLSIIINKDN